jgi:tetratricopeptide (TPR) repeat protein
MTASILAAAFLMAATATAYWGVLGSSFVFDDIQYIVQNPTVAGGLSPSSVAWAFTSRYASNWHPMTWLSHLTDVSLFGLEPAGHHAVNLLLHLVNAALMLRILVRLTGARARSLLATAFFALHPLHVESVAWIAERKDVLSALFFLLAIEAYRRHRRLPGVRRFAAVALWYTLGLLAKPMVITLPAVLLLLDWWPLGCLMRRERGEGALPWGILAEKAALLPLAAGSAAITIIAQRQGRALIDLTHYPVAARLGNAAVSLLRYLGDTCWPSGLAAYYPYPSGGYPGWMAPLALLALACVTAWTFHRWRRPWLAVGWLWYVVMLLPAVGLIQVGSQARADRYTYLPLVGIFVAILWEVESRVRRHRLTRALAAAAGVAAVVALVPLTARQVTYWKDQRAVFNRALAVTRDNWLAHLNLGAIDEQDGRLVEAEAHFREALRVNPRLFLANLRLGKILARQGKIDSGIAAYQQALKVRPRDAETWINLGAAFAQGGRLHEAALAYRQAIAIDPRLTEGHMNLGNVLSDLGRPAEALEAYSRALQLSPDRADLHFNRALALERGGRAEEAARGYTEALRLDPAYRPAREGLARTRWSLPRR